MEEVPEVDPYNVFKAPILKRTGWSDEQVLIIWWTNTHPSRICHYYYKFGKNTRKCLNVILLITWSELKWKWPVYQLVYPMLLYQVLLLLKF